MRLPVWIVFLVAAWVILFGTYRLYLAFRPKKEGEQKRGGLYGMPRRTHGLIGLLYLVLGTFLLLSALGVRLFSISF
jgi:hypothetical protein